MPHSKTPGGQGPSDKFLKQQAQTHGLGADNAPGHTEGGAPGDAPVLGDSKDNKTSADAQAEAAANRTGEQGDLGKHINERPAQ